MRAHLATITAVSVLVGGALLSATLGPDVAGAWPAAPRYECYCRRCYDVGYFVCRNRDYSCNCAACSCYADDPSAAAAADAADQKPTPRDKHGNVNLHSTRNGSNTKTQLYKHKYKQNESNDQVCYR